MVQHCENSFIQTDSLRYQPKWRNEWSSKHLNLKLLKIVENYRNNIFQNKITIEIVEIIEMIFFQNKKIIEKKFQNKIIIEIEEIIEMIFVQNKKIIEKHFFQNK